LCCGSKETTNVIIEIGILDFAKELFVLENFGNIISILFELIGNLVGDTRIHVNLAFLGDNTFYQFMKNKYHNYLKFDDFHSNATWCLGNLFKGIEIANKSNIPNLEEVMLGYYPVI
jgi:hypothetical protein